MALFPRVLTLLLLLLLVQAPLAATDDDPSVVRLFRIEGTYQDHAGGGGIDPMSLLTGGFGPTRSFYALIDKIDEVADDDEIDAVAFDLTLAESYEGGRHRFDGLISLVRSGAFGYTVRVLPRNDLLASPAELGVVAFA